MGSVLKKTAIAGVVGTLVYAGVHAALTQSTGLESGDTVTPFGASPLETNADTIKAIISSVSAVFVALFSANFKGLSPATQGMIRWLLVESRKVQDQLDKEVGTIPPPKPPVPTPTPAPAPAPIDEAWKQSVDVRLAAILEQLATLKPTG